MSLQRQAVDVLTDTRASRNALMAVTIPVAGPRVIAGPPEANGSVCASSSYETKTKCRAHTPLPICPPFRNSSVCALPLTCPHCCAPLAQVAFIAVIIITLLFDAFCDATIRSIVLGDEWTYTMDRILKVANQPGPM